MLMTLVEGAYGRNGDTADVNWTEGGEKARDRDLRHSVKSARETQDAAGSHAL